MTRNCSAGPAQRMRSGNAGVIVLLVLLIGGVGAWLALGESGDDSNDGPEVLTHTVVRERLVVSVTEDGNLESASNKDVKCEIEGGSTILKIVPDGTIVEQGAEIIELDKSGIEEQRRQQEGICERALAAKIKAEQDTIAAAIAVNEYVLGTYEKEKQGIEASIIIAKENLYASNNMLEHTRRMARKGFATPLQVKADEFAVQRADLDLKTAELAQDVLRKFTREKMTTELNSAHKAAEALEQSELKNLEFEKLKLARLEDQESKCIIHAPQAGMVVYANERSRYRSTVAIEQGSAVQHKQTMVRIPVLTEMQAKVLVNESKIDQLKAGMPATLKIQDREFTGRIAEENGIANQPEPTSWFSAQVKEYAVTVQIDGDVAGLKPGMTAEVEIEIEDLPNEITVPVSAVINLGKKYYCWIKTPSGSERRELLLGPTNDRVIAVRDGVVVGDEVILNPRRAVDTDELSKLESAEDEAEEQTHGQPTGSAKASPGSGAPASNPSSGGAGGAGGGQGAGSGGPSLPSFSTVDANGDGKITKDETKGRMADSFDKNDTSKDGSIDASEYNAMIQRIKKRISDSQGGSTAPGGSN